MVINIYWKIREGIIDNIKAIRSGHGHKHVIYTEKQPRQRADLVYDHMSVLSLTNVAKVS